jgi:hypothetical protein
MKLDKKKILGDAKEYYSGKRYGTQSYSLAEGCVDLGQEWIDTHREDYGALVNKSHKQMKKEVRQYVRARVSYSEYNATLLPAFIWWWVAQAIISWIIGKIIDNIYEQKDGGRYLTVWD